MFGHNEDQQQHGQTTPVDPGQQLAQDNSVDTTPELPAMPSPPVPGGFAPQDNQASPVAAAVAAADEEELPSPTPHAENKDQLLDLKRNALEELAPLVDHLEQTPEEKFKTTMMMIQATDDATKIQDAYDLAKKITDEKARAQALLDVVNEINYFTQHDQAA